MKIVGLARQNPGYRRLDSTVTTSVPGKVIIAGEHAVVYGYPAIVAAINKRMKVTVRWQKKGIDIISDSQETNLARRAVAEALKQVGKIEGVQVVIKSEIAVGSGLGSSAALATGIVWGMLPDRSEEEKDKMIKKIEDWQHGKSSGVDQAIVKMGGAISFQKGQGYKKLRIKSWPKFLLIDSGKPIETTGEMVKRVSRGKYKKEFERMAEIGQGWRVELIKENERLLERIGVVGKRAKKMIKKIEKIGGVAKVCGAGGVKEGSGVILAYADQSEGLRRLAETNKWRYFEAQLGVEGARYE